jgi:hypothetical protein
MNFDYIYKITVLICLSIIAISSIVMASSIAEIPGKIFDLTSMFSALLSE